MKILIIIADVILVLAAIVTFFQKPIPLYYLFYLFFVFITAANILLDKKLTERLGNAHVKQPSTPKNKVTSCTMEKK